MDYRSIRVQNIKHYFDIDRHPILGTLLLGKQNSIQKCFICAPPFVIFTVQPKGWKMSSKYGDSIGFLTVECVQDTALIILSLLLLYFKFIYADAKRPRII